MTTEATRDLDGLLEGVRYESPQERSDLARAVASSLARRGKVAYHVLGAPSADSRQRQAAEKRGFARRRSHLRSGKLLDIENRFLCECLIYDRSNTGFRLKLARNISISKNCHLFEDETCAVNLVSIAWRRDCMAGARRCKLVDPQLIKETIRFTLRGRYYAVPD